VLLLAGTSGKIAGVVKDEKTGQPLVGVNVVVEGTTMGAATDKDGYYLILNVPAGKYNIKASMIGYTTVVMRDVLVSIDLTTNLNFNMKATVLEAGESVVVVAERPLLRKDEFTSRHRVTDEEMTVQPVDNFQQIASNQAGVVSGHFRGGRTGEVLVVVDGITMRDPAGTYSGNLGGFTASLPQAAIQEMEVTLGGFSAEYGNVQSGILNLALKEGSDKYSGRARVMTTNFGAKLNDALMGKRTKWLDAVYQHKLENWYQFSLNGPEPLSTLLLGNPKLVNFSFSAEIDDRQQGYFLNQQSKSQSYQGKITTRPNSKMKLAIGGLYSQRDWDSFYFPASKYGPGEDYMYNDFWREKAAGSDTLYHYIYVKNPADYYAQNGRIDSIQAIGPIDTSRIDTTGKKAVRTWWVGPMQDYLWNYHQKSQNLYLIWTHTLSARTYYELRLQRFYSNYHYATPDVDDRDGDGNTEEDLVWDRTKAGPHPIYRELENNYWWVMGDDPGYRDQESWTNTVKLDIVSQITNNHLVKTGLELNLHETSVENISWGLGVGTERLDIWRQKTTDFGAYLQDKLEFQGIIALIGARFDYFDPNGWGDEVYYPADYLFPYSSVDSLGRPILINPKKPKPKMQVSPRIAISHPITDRDVIHFSYGHYFQRPDGYYLYRNMYFQALTKVGNYIGNPNISPEKTVAYEVGVEHLFSNDLKFSVTGYYKDVTNLMNWYKYVMRGLQGIEINVYGNADYGNMKGLEFTLDKRLGRFWGGSINYTYSVAKGRSSSSGSGAGAFTDERRLNYLDFDQTHTINANLTFKLGSWRANFQYEYGSGLPYSSYGTGKINDQRLPATSNTDLRLSRRFKIGAANADIFLDVFNLFDEINIEYLGSTQYYEQYKDPSIVRDERILGGGFIHNPQVYNDHRQYRIGMEINF
jgi:outer membrane receptor protein involved in Fe transport